MYSTVNVTSVKPCSNRAEIITVNSSGAGGGCTCKYEYSALASQLSTEKCNGNGQWIRLGCLEQRQAVYTATSAS